MKKIISSIISLAITLSLYPGSTLVLAEKTGVSFGWTYVDGFDDVVTVPEEIDGKVVDDILLWHDYEEDPIIKKLVISSTVKTMDIGHLDSLEEYEVDENNPYFTTVDGVIYDKEMKKLVYYPPAKPVENFKIPESVEIIGTNSFLFAENLESISVPENVKIIEAGAFAGSKIKNIDLKEGITDIEKYAFGGCSELEQIVLPESLERIGEAFGECTNLKKIIILHKDFEDNGPSSIINPEKDNYFSILRECEGISVYVPDEEYEKYRNGIGDVESNILYKLSELSDPLYNGSSIDTSGKVDTADTDTLVCIKGDVNDDGEFNVADIVLFNKYLLAVSDVELKNWRAADLCQDDRLDVLDMITMKCALIA
ncbi:MAG: leucine-rich repeat protein [Oscillospiraceae bacterium]|nr:leucine-rich repeat protein [Oscillospiraceae bacterium]